MLVHRTTFCSIFSWFQPGSPSHGIWSIPWRALVSISPCRTRDLGALGAPWISCRKNTMEMTQLSLQLVSHVEICFPHFLADISFYRCSTLKSSQHCRWGLNFCGLMIMCFCGVFFHLGMSQTWMATNLKVEYLLSRQSRTVVVYSSIHTIWYPFTSLTQISQSDSTYIKLHPYYTCIYKYIHNFSTNHSANVISFICWRLWARMAESHISMPPPGRVSCSWIGPPRPAFSGLAMEFLGNTGWNLDESSLNGIFLWTRF